MNMMILMKGTGKHIFQAGGLGLEDAANGLEEIES
jgi:hypothetical protein